MQLHGDAEGAPRDQRLRNPMRSENCLSAHALKPAVGQLNSKTFRQEPCTSRQAQMLELASCNANGCPVHWMQSASSGECTADLGPARTQIWGKCMA